MDEKTLKEMNELSEKLSEESVNEIKDVVKSLNEDLINKYKEYEYDELIYMPYFQAYSYDDEGDECWCIGIGDIGLYEQGHAIDCAPDYDINEDSFNALKQHVTAHYNIYLKELAL